MKVYLTTAFSFDEFNAPNWLRSRNNSNTEIITDDPKIADIIIFVELHESDDPYFRKVFKHDLYKKYRDKCVLYHDTDRCITPIPCISPSIEKWQYNPRHKKPFHYIARVEENETINNATPTYSPERQYLYSFIGSRSHPLRNRLFKMAHRPDTFIKDTTGKHGWDLNKNEKLSYELEYRQVIEKSSFVLCPRGIGPSTYRLFETMQLGRAPVIISDYWVEIPGINWQACSIRIAESDIATIPSILQQRSGEAFEMGKRARAVWEEFFSPDIALERITSIAAELLKNEYNRRDAFTEYIQFLRSGWHLKNLLRYKKNKLKRGLLTKGGMIKSLMSGRNKTA